MYQVVKNSDNTILLVFPNCTKKFVAEGRLVNIPKSGVVFFPANTKIGVCKMLHFVKSQIDLATSRSILHNNATIERYNLAIPYIEIDEEEKILSSLEVVEVL